MFFLKKNLYFIFRASAVPWRVQRLATTTLEMPGAEVGTTYRIGRRRLEEEEELSRGEGGDCLYYSHNGLSNQRKRQVFVLRSHRWEERGRGGGRGSICHRVSESPPSSSRKTPVQNMERKGKNTLIPTKVKGLFSHFDIYFSV